MMTLFKRLVSFFQKNKEVDSRIKSTSDKMLIDFQQKKSNCDYLSAKDELFDKSYFLDPDTNRFKFPKYNKDNKGFLVEIKDITNYKEYYFDDYSKAERERFSFEDFEKIFLTPEVTSVRLKYMIVL